MEMKHRVGELFSLARDEGGKSRPSIRFVYASYDDKGTIWVILPNLTIMDASDQASTCRKVLREIRVADSTLRPRDRNI